MVNEMIENYKKMWINIFDYNGKINRRAFWLTVLANVIVSIVIGFIAGLIRFGGLSYIYSVAAGLAGLSMSVRRLHDVNKSGWYILMSLIPLVGWIFVLIELVKDSSK